MVCSTYSVRGVFTSRVCLWRSVTYRVLPSCGMTDISPCHILGLAIHEERRMNGSLLHGGLEALYSVVVTWIVDWG